MPDTELGKTIAKNLKRIMYDKRVSSAELARMLGIRQTTVSGWLNEYKVPRGDTIDALCELLRCSRTDLKKKGVDIRISKNLMGHADIKTTANIYDHDDGETLMLAAKQMGIDNTLDNT